MRKVLAIVILVLTFFIIYFLQANFFSWFTIAGVKPNLFVVFALLIGLFAGKKVGLVLGFIFGCYLDLLVGRTIGISGLLLAIIGFLGEYLNKNFSKESRITIMLMSIACTIAYELFTYLYYIFSMHIPVELLAFVKILLVEAIYNAIIVVIIYPIIQKVGAWIEDTFKNNNVLTRYF